MSECQDCEGTGKRVVYACPGFRRTEATCLLCDGTGQESAQRIAWRAAGELLRRQRIGRQRTMGEMAAAFGFAVVEVSRMEHGVTDPAPLEAAWASLAPPIEAAQ